jgi:6-phosphofructokinase 1
LPEDSFTYRGSYTLQNSNFGPDSHIDDALKFLMGGPRRSLMFKPERVKAVIVTCGGLCPGLNVIIREVTMALHFNYGVKEVYGVQFGYKGFYDYPLVRLDPEVVKTIHHTGGTMLGSSRGGFDL